MKLSDLRKHKKFLIAAVCVLAAIAMGAVFLQPKAERSQRLHYIARVAQTTIGNQRNTCTLQCLCHIINGRQLGNTHTGNHTGSADGTRTDAYLYSISTSPISLPIST